ncbi:amidohydrolase [Gordonia sp. GONU]|uniref:amidohydrolase n=1 Tax=Gordonia sp. GONU TaxID=2972949 RepID=UPI0021AD1D64|nr:amidohydrolase [Gordonia sp. GONU]MCR8897508.1 amidohydrolase [Gordonia sp. GONU]
MLAGLDDLRGPLEELYQQIHQHPELSHQERETSTEVARQLRSFGYDVRDGIGGTGVVGILSHGDGPTVLMRADMDALPIREDTGLPYASTRTVTGVDGGEVPVMHACGHDVHVACLLGAASLLAGGRDHWSGRVITLFQPAEEVGDGARRMIDDDLGRVVGDVDVALAQHVLPYPAGHVGTRYGAVLSAAESLRITVYGRGGHGSMPQTTVDPVVLAAMIVIRLQAIVSREIAPTEPAVLTVGSITSGSKSNIIPDHAVLQLNIRTYSDRTRTLVLDAVHRIVTAECQASGSPREPDFETFDHFPATTNDPAATGRVRAAFDEHFGADRTFDLPLQTASEDFSDIPRALKIPYTYWGLGGIDPEVHRTAEESGRLDRDIPANHSPQFAPVVQPTLDTGTEALVVAALAWLGPSNVG